MNEYRGPTGGNAFPVPGLSNDETFNGMTLRDYFAAHAPNPPDEWHGGQRRKADIIEWRWNYADAMLQARARA